LVSICALHEAEDHSKHTLMLMSLSSTNSTVCPGGRSPLTDESELRSGDLCEGEFEGSVLPLEAVPPVSWIIGSDLVVTALGVKGNLIWFLESSIPAWRMLAANLVAASGDWGRCDRSESPLIVRGLGVIGVGVCEK